MPSGVKYSFIFVTLHIADSEALVAKLEYFNDTTSIIERTQIDFFYRYSYCYSSTKMITSISNIKIIRYMEVYCNVDYS